jgi:predicted nucleic acid-binding protein
MTLKMRTMTPMSSSAFSAEGPLHLIADASVVINLNATGHARRIIEALPGRVLVPSNAVVELVLGDRHGHNDAQQLNELFSAGIVGRIDLEGGALTLYESLIDGSRGLSLGDGEAATIAIACAAGAVAVLDEKKARRLCETQLPALAVHCTAQILLLSEIEQALGRHTWEEALLGALRVGRMRVPGEFIDAVISIIGQEAASSCTSLPRAIRIDV